MGAVDFYTAATGADLRDAFERAREEAAWEHGRGGYSGTVYEKDNVELIDEPRRDVAAATQRAGEILNGSGSPFCDKRGPAGALPITANDGEDGWLIFGCAPY